MKTTYCDLNTDTANTVAFRDALVTSLTTIRTRTLSRRSTTDKREKARAEHEAEGLRTAIAFIRDIDIVPQVPATGCPLCDAGIPLVAPVVTPRNELDPFPIAAPEVVAAIEPTTEDAKPPAPDLPLPKLKRSPRKRKTTTSA